MKFQPLQLVQISTKKYFYMEKLIIIPLRRESVPLGICLHLFQFSFVSMHYLTFSSRLERAEAIVWEKSVPAAQKKDPSLSIETFYMHLQDINYEEYRKVPVSRQKVNPGKLRSCNYCLTTGYLGTSKINGETSFLTASTLLDIFYNYEMAKINWERIMH